MAVENKKNLEAGAAVKTESSSDRQARLTNQAKEGAAAAELFGAETSADQPTEIGTPPKPERKLKGALEKFSGLNFVYILGDHNSAETYARTLGEKPERDASLGSREEFLENLEKRLQKGELIDVMIVNQNIMTYNTSENVRQNEKVSASLRIFRSWPKTQLMLKP